jgi:hypothetical protein
MGFAMQRKPQGGAAAQRISKSFLVLFFKKEHLPFSLPGVLAPPAATL